MKKCSKCKIDKPDDDFGWKEKNKSRKSECKSCFKERRITWRKSYETDYCVYYLPEEHWIGMSKNLKTRLNNHKSMGRITDGVEVLCYFKRRVDAHLLETMFHQRGYNGF